MVSRTLLRPKTDGFQGSTVRGPGKKTLFNRLSLIGSLVIGLVWLAPAIYLLYLNFSGHIVGLSIACPSCKLNPTFKANVGSLQGLEERDHDVLGAFQIVSKALEIWFIFVATSLVYSLCMLIARSWRGLPLGYMTSYVEFSDLRSIMEPGFWKVAMPPRERTEKRRHLAMGLYGLAIFIAIMSVASNLMGPATAVLLIPTLQWKTINSTDIGYVGSPIISQSPEGSLFESNCTASQLATGNYSCAIDRYGDLMDAQVAAGTVANFEYERTKALLPNNIQVGSVSAVINASSIALTNWVPNFNVVGEISNAFRSWYDRNNRQRTNFLQTRFIQNGPSYSFAAGCAPTNSTLISFSDGRELQCYVTFNWNGPNDLSGNRTLYCLPAKSSPDIPLESATFSIEGRSLPENTVDVTVFSTGLALLLPYANPICKLPADISQINETTCPWDKLQGNDEYAYPNQTLTIFSTARAAALNRSVTCQSFVAQGVAEYVLDATAPLFLVSQTNVQLNSKEYLFQHPDWYLAAWSVDRNGSVDGSRQAAQSFVQSTLALTDQTPVYQDVAAFALKYVFTVSLARSMINIDTISLNETPANVTEHPKVTISQQIYVYAYGNDSRTLKLGYVVVIFGCVVVLARTILVLLVNIPQLSAVGMLRTAIKHTDSPEFADSSKSEGELAKLRYRLVTGDDGEVDMVRETEGKTHANDEEDASVEKGEHQHNGTNGRREE